jgi:hypothetical protein
MPPTQILGTTPTRFVGGDDDGDDRGFCLECFMKGDGEESQEEEVSAEQSYEKLLERPCSASTCA